MDIEIKQNKFFIPYYTVSSLILYVTMFYTYKPSFDVLVLHMSTPKLAYTWYTYSIIHLTNMHLWVNMFTLLIYGMMVEIDNFMLRTSAIMTLSIFGGAFAASWQARIQHNFFNLMGVSAGVYGLLGAQIGNLIINYPEFGLFRRLIYISAIIGAVICDVTVTAVMYNPQISYSGHIGGFFTGALAGTIFMINKKKLNWERTLQISSACVIGVYFLMGIVNLLTLN